MNKIIKKLKLKHLFNIFIKKYYLNSLMVFTRLIKEGKDLDHSDFSALIDTFLGSLITFDRKYKDTIDLYKEYFIDNYVKLVESHKNKYIDGIYNDILLYFTKRSRKMLQVKRDIDNKVEYIKKLFEAYEKETSLSSNVYGCCGLSKQDTENEKKKDDDIVFNMTLVSTSMIDIIALLNTNKVMPLHILDPYLMKIKSSSNDVQTMKVYFEQEFEKVLLKSASDKIIKFCKNLANIDISKTLKNELYCYFGITMEDKND